MTPSGIEPATFRLVARCLNQLVCVITVIFIPLWVGDVALRTYGL